MRGAEAKLREQEFHFLTVKPNADGNGFRVELVEGPEAISWLSSIKSETVAPICFLI